MYIHVYIYIFMYIYYKHLHAYVPSIYENTFTVYLKLLYKHIETGYQPTKIP